jgi:hypothetical protein
VLLYLQRRALRLGRKPWTLPSCGRNKTLTTKVPCDHPEQQ